MYALEALGVRLGISVLNYQTILYHYLNNKVVKTIYTLTSYTNKKLLSHWCMCMNNNNVVYNDISQTGAFDTKFDIFNTFSW